MKHRINETSYAGLLTKKQGMDNLEDTKGVHSMELHYETLIPVEYPENTALSVGTVLFVVEGRELPLDFNITETCIKKAPCSHVHLDTILKDFNPQIFADDYQELGLAFDDLNYVFFANRLSNTYLAEVYTEFFYTENEIYLPLALKSACLFFQDGSRLDYSSFISNSANEQLSYQTAITTITAK